jgi:hypothetical protein
MPNQVDGAFVRAPCPVPSCPACEPNSGSVLPSLSTKAYSSLGADIVEMSGYPTNRPLTARGAPRAHSSMPHRN